MPSKRTALLAACFLVGSSLMSNMLLAQNLVILHSNDTHSQIEPNPKTASRDADRGGVLRRHAAIEQVRNQEEQVLLVDAGDFVQGTPYFNFFKGKVEIMMMNKLGYEVATLGNHEFDNGMQSLYDMVSMAEFPVVSANYDFTGTQLEGLVQPTTIIQKGDLKIGVIGLGSILDGLVAQKNTQGVRQLDAVEVTNKYAAQLKAEGCDLVMVLSHLGYNKSDERGDRLIASQSTDVDLIIGGHSHTLLPKGVVVTNKEGEPVRIAQAGGRGFNLGRIDLSFE